MRRTVPLASAALALCRGLRQHHRLRGFAPSPGAVDKLEVKTQSREDVQRLIGTPSSVATFNPNVWYYISARQEYWGPSEPWLTEQSVIQITFDEFGPRADINYYDLSDAQNITMVSRVTPTSGKELTVLEQILGNVGKFSGPTAAEQSGRADRRRPLIGGSSRPKKKPRSCDRGFSVDGDRLA